jgi:hypothetical protein
VSSEEHLAVDELDCSAYVDNEEGNGVVGEVVV